MRCCLFLSLMFCAFSPWAQNEQDSLVLSARSFSWSAYFDVFYAYDFNEPNTNFRQPFLFNHNRHHEFNINHALIRGAYHGQRTRAKLGFHTGTYVQDNYAGENFLTAMLYEANVGVSLDKKEKFWLDAGIMESHIGFESAIAFENQTLTRSLCAENSPYFSSGASLTYQPKAQWAFQVLALNGWQRIQRDPENSLLSFGTKINYTAENMELNWSTFAGTNDPDSTRRMRYFSNIYAVYTLNSSLSVTGGFDYGMQQALHGSSDYHHWFNLTTIVQLSFAEQFRSALRFEYFSDYNRVLMQTSSNLPFEVYATSLNCDYKANENVLFRLEYRLLQSAQSIFEKKGQPKSTNSFILGALIFNI